MATLAQIRTNVLAKLADSGGSILEPTAAQVDAQINSVIQFYQDSPWCWFSEATATGFMIIGDPILPQPADFGQFIQPDAIVIQQNNVRYPLLQGNPLMYDSLYVGGNGLPRYFIYQDGTILVYFPPDQAYLYYIHYRKTYADLVADSDTNDFLTYCPRLIEYRTLGECYRDYRGDLETAAYYMGQDGSGGVVKGELQKIKQQSYDRSATGNLAVSNITARARTTIYSR